MEIIILDGRDMPDRNKAYEYLDQVIRFPEYFGKNLDALNDCLSELGKNVIIILTNGDAMRESLGKYADKMIRVFSQAAEEAGFTFIEK